VAYLAFPTIEDGLGPWLRAWVLPPEARVGLIAHSRYRANSFVSIGSHRHVGENLEILKIFSFRANYSLTTYIFGSPLSNRYKVVNQIQDYSALEVLEILSHHQMNKRVFP
jgi:hypothetical protein